MWKARPQNPSSRFSVRKGEGKSKEFFFFGESLRFAAVRVFPFKLHSNATFSRETRRAGFELLKTISFTSQSYGDSKGETQLLEGGAGFTCAVSGFCVREGETKGGCVWFTPPP